VPDRRFCCSKKPNSAVLLRLGPGVCAEHTPRACWIRSSATDKEYPLNKVLESDTYWRLEGRVELTEKDAAQAGRGWPPTPHGQLFPHGCGV
jgi:hypothetical protein